MTSSFLSRLSDNERTLARRTPAPTRAHVMKAVLTAERFSELGFSEWTSAGRLRHPRFLGLRDDKPAQDVVREAP